MTPPPPSTPNDTLPPPPSTTSKYTLNPQSSCLYKTVMINIIETQPACASFWLPNLDFSLKIF